MLNIGKLCKKFGISDITWKLAMSHIVHHLLMTNLFPTDDLIHEVLERLGLKDKDKSGEIFSTVSSYMFSVCSWIQNPVREFKFAFSPIALPSDNSFTIPYSGDFWKKIWPHLRGHRISVQTRCRGESVCSPRHRAASAVAEPIYIRQGQ